MAITSGLTPFREDQPKGSRRSQRNVPQEAARIRAPGLTPQARPVETYHSTPQAPRTNDLIQLADTLSSLNPALARFGSASLEKKKADDPSGRVVAKLMGASPEERARLLAEDPEMQTELGKAAAMRFSGQENANLALNAMATAYDNDFDKAGGNFDEFQREILKPFLEANGGDAGYLKSFTETVGPGVNKLRAGHAQVLSGEKFAVQQQGITNAFLGIARKTEAQGLPPEQQAESMLGEIYGNARFLQMSPTDQKKALAGVADTLAEEGKYDVVNALANAKRKNADGTEGSLLDDDIIGGSLAKSVLRAKSIRDNKNHEAGVEDRDNYWEKFTSGNATAEDEQDLRDLRDAKPGLISEEYVNSLIARNRNEQEQQANKVRIENQKAALRQDFADQETRITSMGIEAVKSGKLWDISEMRVVDKEGNEKIVSGEDARKRAVTDFEQRSDATARANKETFEQQVAREIPMFASNGIVPEKWKGILAAGASSLSSAVINKRDIPEPAQRAYGLYKLLRANKAQVLRDLVPKDKADLFETWRIAEEDLGADPKQALYDAVDQNADPTGRPARQAAVAVKGVREAAESGAIQGRLPTFFGGQVATENGSMLADAIQVRAEHLAKRGLDPDKAIEQAAEQVKLSHVNINGWWIDASDKRLPPTFPDLATIIVKEYANKHGAQEGLEASDLTVRQIGNGHGAWRIVHKTTGAAVDVIGDSQFTSEDLMQADLNRKSEIDRMMAEDATNAASTAYEPYLQVGDPEGFASISLGPFLPKNWQDPKEQEKLREGRRSKYRKDQTSQKAVRDTLDARRSETAKTVEKRGGEIVDAVKQIPRKNRQPAQDGEDVGALRAKLPEGQQNAIRLAIKARADGLPDKDVTALLRRAGVSKKFWPE